MFQIDNSSTVAQMPSPSAAGTPGFFTDGNPATGQAATILPTEFMNMLMMELVNIVQAGNITPDKTKTNQVLTALNALFAPQSAFSNSKATSGYQKLQGGLIEQWGTVAVSSNGTNGGIATVALPIAFPNACLNVTGNLNSNTYMNGESVINTYINSASQITIVLDNVTGNEGAGTFNVFWRAVGY